MRSGNVKTSRRLVRAVALAAGLTIASVPAAAKDLVVFAAASLKNALDGIGSAYTRQTGEPVVFSYAGSNVLAKQIEAGAPADVFISADLDWMDFLSARRLIRPGTRVPLLANALVLVAAKDGPVPAHLDLSASGFVATLGTERLAMANVEAVPAGKYGKAALEHLGVWQAVRGQVAQAENVRAALLLVARGEAPLGIVYRSDAVSEPGIRVVALFPEGGHPTIRYPAAVTTDSVHLSAGAFLAFLRSGEAKAQFEAQGFTVLATPGSGS